MEEHLKSLKNYRQLTLEQLFYISNEMATICSISGYTFLRNTHTNLIDQFSDKMSIRIPDLSEKDKDKISLLTNQIEIAVNDIEKPEMALSESRQDNPYDCSNRCFKIFERTGDAIEYQNCLKRCPDSGGVIGPKAAILYKHINYSGAFVPIEFDADNRDLRRNQFNDMTSSIILAEGWKLLVSEHVQHGGKRVWITESIPDLRNNPIGNDTISSLIAVRK